MSLSEQFATPPDPSRRLAEAAAVLRAAGWTVVEPGPVALVPDGGGNWRCQWRPELLQEARARKVRQP